MANPLGLGGTTGGGSAAFKKLLLNLLDQYESDLAQATQRAEGPTSSSTATTATGEASSKEESPVVKTVQFEPYTEEQEQEDEKVPVNIPGTLRDTAKQTDPGGDDSHNLRGLTSSKTVGGTDLTKFQTRASARIEDLAAERQIRETQVKSASAIGKFVRSSNFDKLSATLLLLNAIFIGWQVEQSFEEETALEIVILDYIFCVLFIMELSFRIYGFGCRHFWTDPGDRAWNIFDSFIVFVSTVDTIISSATQGVSSPLSNVSVLRVIRVVRIVRVLRIIRVMRFFKDLRILLAAVVSTVKTAWFALLLILFIMYMFGIAITQLSAEHIKDMRREGNDTDENLHFYFGSMPRSIFTLFMTIAGGVDWKDCSLPLFLVGEGAVFFFLLYVALMTLCVMNVLLGIFCQCALDTAANDKENMIQVQLQEKHRFVETLSNMFAGWDDSGDGKCSLEEFQNHLADDNTQALLSSLEMESHDALMLFELLDADHSGEVDLNEFVTGCITLRGGAKAIHMEKLNSMHKNVAEQYTKMEKSFMSMQETLNSLVRALRMYGIVHQPPGV